VFSSRLKTLLYYKGVDLQANKISWVEQFSNTCWLLSVTIMVRPSSTELSHELQFWQEITHAPGERDVDDRFDGNVDVDGVVVHCRQILLVGTGVNVSKQRNI